MKKIISIVFFSVLLTTMHFKLYAQAPVTTLSPAKFTAEDQVTLTADVTGTPMDGISPVYIWIWCYHNTTDQANDANATTALTDGTTWSPLATPDQVLMTHVSGNIWSYTFTGTNLFGLAPGTMYSFNYLIRNIDGTKQTNNALAKGSGYKFDPLIFTPTMLRVFPQSVDTSDVVSLNFDQSLATTINDQRMAPVSVTITAYDEEATPVQIGNPLTIPVTNTSGAIWTGTFIPSANFTTAANGHKLAGFKYNFNGTILDITGSPATVSTASSELFAFTPMK